ncbi:G-protein coupled receptor 183-like [Erpetoichthys calabaricus]|uniref:G-protein coupled receptor 183-like n=1 Tax=Erpetoichthys calabaricus TaxID=27687 RepID=UPI0022340DC7|nr:G-protein coupled receptor 183-like [Erpetoichthys calabaricus]
MTVPLAVNFENIGDYFIFAFHVLLATCTVLVAGAVVVAILGSKSLRTENRVIFMLSTSISDTLSGFGWYYNGLFDVKEFYPQRNGTYFILPTLLGVNFITILTAQIDRYVAVSYPFFYARRITLRVVIGICVFIWTFNYLTVLLMNVVPWQVAVVYNAVNTLGVQILAVIIMLGLNIKLYLIVRYQLNREQASPEADGKRASLLLIIAVTMCFLAFWTPGFINISLCGLTSYGYRFKNNAMDPFVVLIRMNPLSTPSLYIIGSLALRKAILKFLRRDACCAAKRVKVSGSLSWQIGPQDGSQPRT